METGQQYVIHAATISELLNAKKIRNKEDIGMKVEEAIEYLKNMMDLKSCGLSEYC